MKSLKIALLELSLLISACAVAKTSTDPGVDPFLWLEEVQSPEALNWVNAHSDQTQADLSSRPIYKKLEPEIEKIVLSKDRIPEVREMGGWLYTFWQDGNNERGVWKRVTPSEYQKKNPKWDVVLDLDELATSEKENWVFKGADCLAPEYNRCLIQLSRGGKDAVVVREFWINRRKFMDHGGFVSPESKQETCWNDSNSLLVATDFGSDSMTLSGYPRILKIWKRGEPLSEAKELYRVEKEDLGVACWRWSGPTGTIRIIQRSLNFFETESFLLKNNQLVPLPLPKDAIIQGIDAGNRVLVQPRKDWALAAQSYPAGSLLAIPLKSLAGGGFSDKNEMAKIEVVFRPTESRFLQSTIVTRSGISLLVLDHVTSKVLKVWREPGNKWVSAPIDLPGFGAISIMSANPHSENVYLEYENFLTPPSVYHLKRDRATQIRQLPSQFQAEGLSVEQRFAISLDGVKVPYFYVFNPARAKMGPVPTLLYGYGGFEISQVPFYAGVIGKAWLERGGSFVLANIRGGGEYGPKWHQAALKENRQRSYDDFIAIAEDLISKKATEPKQLAIKGASNGGLLVGAAMVQRPDLFQAVVCMVPLLDMLRFHKLLAGHSWIGEYGNPDIPEERANLEKYSPYQNLKAGVNYPNVFFYTSTLDDRVHPGHARKMAAKMMSLGSNVTYYENTEGGHSAAANLKQRIKRSSMEYTYLSEQLGL